MRKNTKRIDPRYFLNEQEEVEYGREGSGKFNHLDAYGVVDLRPIYKALPDWVKQRYEKYVQQPQDEKIIGDLNTPEMVFKFELRANLFGRDGVRHPDDPLEKSGQLIGQSGGVGSKVADKRSLISAINNFVGKYVSGFDATPYVSDASEEPMQKFRPREEPKYQVSPASPMKESMDKFKKFLNENEQLEDKDKFMRQVIGIPMITNPRYSAINMKEQLDEWWDAYGNESELQKWVAMLRDPYYLKLVEKQNEPNFKGTASGFELYSGMDGIKEGIEAWIRSKVG